MDVATCIKQIGNWSHLEAAHRFDSATFDAAKFRADMAMAGPKLAELVDTIRRLDAVDMRTHGHVHKHFIYSDIKSPYGAKLIAAALAANGFEHGYALKGGSFKLNALPARTRDTFATMTSVTFFGKPVGIKFRREMLRRFNARPSNVFGDDLRIIILDSGFREGVDLFDIKYVHLFEPILTAADQKQAIGRATRFCGQKGLQFHSERGWPLEVFRYETTLPEHIRAYIMDEAPKLLSKTEATFFDLFIKFTNIDPRKITFARELEVAVIHAAVDRPLTTEIHAVRGGAQGGAAAVPVRATFADMEAFVRQNYASFAWPPVKVENGCAAAPTATATAKLEFSPSQNFIRNFLTTRSPYHGMLAFHSVGTGKTCTAIATATSSFEQDKWTILYVTKHTLKGDVWKNMFDQSCSVILQQSGVTIPEEAAARMRLLSKSWSAIQPLSYRQFSNMLDAKSALYTTLVGINGRVDPLRKTFVIIDEAHKLFAQDVVGTEKGDVDVIRRALHHSYQSSGTEACKVLLMTGTPYTDDPMDMMRLINLLRDGRAQLPETFDDFATAYLASDGTFTEKGYMKFLNDMTGLVSYLNREKDMRTFAYPILHDVFVPMSTYEFEAELDELMINQVEMKRNKDKYEDMKAKLKIMLHDIKRQHQQVIQEKATQLKECANVKTAVKACVDDAKATAKVQTAEVRATAKAATARCPSGKGVAAEKAKCKAEIKAWLTTELATIKAQTNAQSAKCKELKAASGCETLRTELAAMKKLAKEDVATAQAQVRARQEPILAAMESTIERQKGLDRKHRAAVKAGVDGDRSQQSALDKCLAADVTPAVRRMKKGELAPDVGLGSRANSPVLSTEQPPIFVIAGHGGEYNVPFDERPIVPDGTHLVVFSTCFKPNYADNLCNFLDIFVQRQHLAMLADPVKHRRDIEDMLGSPIHVYAPGDRMPKLINNLFLNFDAHKTAILKSGVFQVPDIPVFEGPMRARDERIVGHRPCEKFSTVIKGPALYSASVHKQAFKGNIYRPAEKHDVYQRMKQRSFAIEDIMRRLGPGVYYSTGCRSPVGAPPTGEELMDIYDKSEEQQKRKTAT